MNPILVALGIMLVFLGIGTIAYPQRIHNEGGADRRYGDGVASDFGRIQLRGLGLVSVLIDLALFPIGII